ncbi:MAG: GGDEF domain-containing protein [Chitinophagaceae bacterium]
MPKAKPIITDAKFGIIGFLVLVTAVIGIIIKWKEFYDFFVPDGVVLNWRFALLVIFIAIFVVWFIMNHFWKKEYDEHEITKKDRDNLKDALKISENERLTDVITGIPNSRSLEKDIEEYFSLNRPNKKMQFIFIDLKDFRKVNGKFGFNKTNDLLRAIAQTIYKRMRRNEDMYKYASGDKSKSEKESFYRVYPGGDEFVFIIEGDQSDALGFSNRLVSQFEQLSQKTQGILGQQVKLSFHCAIVEMDARDSFKDIFKKAEDCYRIAKEGVSDFTICWHPNNIERILSKDAKKQAEYERTRKLYEVMTIIDKEYE